MDKLYNFKSIRNKININDYLFDFSIKDKNKFSVLLPPPNITGQLHIGHSLNYILQDLLIKYNFLKAKNTLWIPGFDHAGIATQVKVQKFILEKYNRNLNSFSDKEKKIFFNDWVFQKKEIIEKQWKKSKLSLSYSSSKYLFSIPIQKKITKAFIKLYKDNLIYIGDKIVNWDIELQTAISDIEVVYKKSNNKLFYIKYFIDGSNKFLVVATTRPETIFADVALFINPKDKRYSNLKNLKVINPLTNKKIPILFDNYVDVSFGSGVLKCTPAHDKDDFELATKYNLPITSCIDEYGKMKNVIDKFLNKDRFVCRKMVIDFFEKNNLLEKIEVITSNISYSSRTNSIIEPLISKQWFLKTKQLAKKVIENQKNTATKVNFFPKIFENTLLKWLYNIKDWCISRQIYWGHKIPAFFNIKTNEVIVDDKWPIDKENWKASTDVLDTWFSSALWPLLALDYDFDKKTQNQKFNTFFPTDVLVSGYDIIFFWIVKMLLFSYYFEKKKPFEKVLIHGLIRDEKGRKMSKSLNNGIDPVYLIDKYGNDSFRLYLISNIKLGQDINFNIVQLENNHFFINKIWNLYRFFNILKKDTKETIDSNIDFNKLLDHDVWLLHNYNFYIKELENNLQKYNFTVCYKIIVNFVKNIISNNYLTLFRYKNNINSIKLLNKILTSLLISLFPFIPIVSSYLYKLFTSKNIKNEKWPNKISFSLSKNLYSDFLINIIENINTLKQKNKLKKSQNLNIFIPKISFTDIEYKEIKKTLIFFNITLLEEKKIKQDYQELNISYLTVFLERKNIVVFYETIVNSNTLKINQKEKEKLCLQIKKTENLLKNKSFLKNANKILIENTKKRLSFYKKKLNSI